MDRFEQYEFDRLGYLVVPGMLTPDEVTSLSAAVDRLEEHALAHVDKPPRKVSPGGFDYHQNPEYGYHASGGRGPGLTIMIEDFFNADPAFDVLVGHPRTMGIIRTIVQGPVRINNSELRIRYQGNNTVAHFGGPAYTKYRYGFNQQGIDAMMVRMVYFLHDVGPEQGPLCVVPGTHKTNYPSPYTDLPAESEPGMIGLEVKAGDAVLFTENLRHGGFSNVSEQPRKTLHVGYGPFWMMSQNSATMDEPQYILPKTLERYDPEQRSLFVIDQRTWTKLWRMHEPEEEREPSAV